jgi:hypothetical protein
MPSTQRLYCFIALRAALPRFLIQLKSSFPMKDASSEDELLIFYLLIIYSLDMAFKPIFLVGLTSSFFRLLFPYTNLII